MTDGMSLRVQGITLRKRCVLAFFGIDRRLDITWRGIEEHILEPARQVFDVRSVGFLWSPHAIKNPRSGEFGELVRPRIELLPEGEYKVQPPVRLAEMSEYAVLRSFGDNWNDSFASFGNLYLQLMSLKRVTEMAMQAVPDCVVFVRPDLMYIDTLAPALMVARRTDHPLVQLPGWQPHGGMNDRFAICCGEQAIRAYGERIDAALEFCTSLRRPLHSEQLVAYAMVKADLPIRRICTRAYRVRLDGARAQEDFSFRGWRPAVRRLAGLIRRSVWTR